MSKQDKNKPSFSKFGKDFQESLCQLILVDRPFADQIMEVLDENFLELHYLRVFVRLIMDYREKYTVHPSYKIMISVGQITGLVGIHSCRYQYSLSSG